MIVNVSPRSVTLLLAAGVASTSAADSSTNNNNLRQGQRRTAFFGIGNGKSGQGKSGQGNGSGNGRGPAPDDEPALPAPVEAPKGPRGPLEAPKGPRGFANPAEARKSANPGLRGAWNGDMAPRVGAGAPDSSDDYKNAAAAAAAAPMDPAATSGLTSGAGATTPTEEPSFTLSKSSFAEFESITATFSVGNPAHAYYSSSEVPTLSLDYNYPEWSVGLFMRDADPQGGTLTPIVSINLCSALGSACDATNVDWETYSSKEISMTFDNSALAVMDGQWPIQVSEYGTGYDAYVLDANGAGAIGPLEFYIQTDQDMMGNAAPARYGGAKGPAVESPNEPAALSGLKKYNHSSKKPTEPVHAAPSSSGKINTAIKGNGKLTSGNGVSMSSLTEAEEFASLSSTQQGPMKDTITSSKMEYQSDEDLTIDFSIDTANIHDPENLGSYKVGIFMRMANPQGGALDPVVSLPLASLSTEAGVSSGSVTFSSATMGQLLVGTWPIDLYEWGTGFDAYVLDANGAEVTGPVQFVIMMDE